MAEQNVNSDELNKDERLDESDLEQVSGGVVMHDDTLRKQEQNDKLTRGEQNTK